MSRFLGVMLLCANAAVAPAQSESVPTAVVRQRIPEYSPPTAEDRMDWVIRGTVGLPNATAALITAGLGTWTVSPREYGSHWDGFGERYGLHMADSATGRTMEAALGALWHEDPRYDRAAEQSLKNRLGHVLKMTVMSTDGNGGTMPAYARYIAVSGDSFLSNKWRPDSQATAIAAAERIPMGFADRLIGNAFSEFWPDVRKHIFKFRKR